MSDFPGMGPIDSPYVVASITSRKVQMAGWWLLTPNYRIEVQYRPTWLQRYLRAYFLGIEWLEDPHEIVVYGSMAPSWDKGK